MTLCMGILSRKLVCNEVLGYMVPESDCVIACGEPVLLDYLPNIVACDNMRNNSIH